MSDDLPLLGRPWPHLAARLARVLGEEDLLLATPRRVELRRPFDVGHLSQAFWRDASLGAIRHALAHPPRPRRRDPASVLGGPTPTQPATRPAFSVFHTAGAPLPRPDGLDEARRALADVVLPAVKALGRPEAPWLLARRDAALALDGMGRTTAWGTPARLAAFANLPATLRPLQDDPTLLARLHAALPEGETAMPAPRTAHDRLALGLDADLQDGLRRLLGSLWSANSLRARRQGPGLALYDLRPDGPLRLRLLALVPA